MLRAHVCDAGNSGAPSRAIVSAVLDLDKILVVHAVSRGCGVEFAAVIGLRQVVDVRTVQRDRSLRNRQLHRIADCPIDVVIRIVVTAGTGGQSHSVVARGRAAHGRAATVTELGGIEARVAARGLRRADIGLQLARIDSARVAAVHRDVHGGFVDGHLTIHHRERHHLEVGVRVLEESRHEVHVRGAEIRAGGRAVGNAAGEVDVVGIVTRRLGVRDRVTRHRVRRTVVGHFVRLTRNRHRSIHLLDGQTAVRHMELDIELVVVVLKLRCIKTHIIGAGIGALRSGCSRTDEREVILIVNSSVGNRLRIIRHTANLHLISAHALLRAVVILRGRMACDIHNHNTGRHNLQPTISHGEGDLQVGVIVGELAGKKTHRIGADRRARGRRIAAEHHIVLAEECAVGFHLITCHFLQSSGKFVHLRMTGNRHRHLNRLDGLVTVGHVEGHVLEVGVRVGELVVGKTHIGGTGILAGSRRRAAEREVGFGVESRICIGDHIVGNRVLRTVIQTRVVVTGNRHLSVHLVDGEFAVGDVEDHIVNVGVGIDKLRGGKAHRIDTGIGLVQRRLSVEREVRGGIVRVARSHNLHVIAGHAVCLRIVVGRKGMSGDVHNHGSLRHNPQPTVHLREGDVVVRIVVAELVQIEGHRIGRVTIGTAHAFGDSGTRVHHMGHIVVAVVSHRRVAGHRLRRAGIGYHRGITRHRHRDVDRGDSEGAGFVGHIVVALHGRTGRSNDVSPGILAGRRVRLGTTQRIADCVRGIAVHQTAHRGGKRRIRRTERFRLVVSLHREIRTGDGEFGRVVRHRVVALHSRTNRRDHILADILAGHAAHRIGDDTGCVVVLQTRHRSGESGISGTVSLRLGNRLHRDRSIRDGQLTGILVSHLVVIQGIAGCGNQVFAHIFARRTAETQLQQLANGRLRVVVHQTVDGCRRQRLRIRLAIHLRVVLGRHRQQGLLHVDRHLQLLLAAVRFLGAGRREGHGVVTRRRRRTGKGVVAEGETGRKVGVRQRGMTAERERHVIDSRAVGLRLLQVSLIVRRENHLRIDRDGEFDRVARTADGAVRIRISRGHRDGGRLRLGRRILQRSGGDVARAAFVQAGDARGIGTGPAVAHRTVGDGRAEDDSRDGAVAADRLAGRPVHHHRRVDRHGDGERRALTDIARGGGHRIDSVLDGGTAIAERAAHVSLRGSGRSRTAGDLTRRSRPLIGGGVGAEGRGGGSSGEITTAADVRCSDGGEDKRSLADIRAVEGHVNGRRGGTAFGDAII